jgi:hypothetical protein
MRCICGHPGAEYFALGGVLTFDVMLWPSWLSSLSS